MSAAAFTITEDRRQRRSSDPEQAIGYQLQQVVADFNLDCCIIVDDSGNQVAISSESATPFIRQFGDMLSALAMFPDLRDSHIEELQKKRPDLEVDQLAACVFRAGGRRLFVGAIGDEAVMNQVAIMRAIMGTRRIHGS